jgi:hypothetical protein
MLHREPERRFQTPAELVEALDAFLAGGPEPDAKFAVENAPVAKAPRTESSVDLDATQSTNSLSGDSDASYLDFLGQVSMDQTLDELGDTSSELSAMSHFERLKASSRDKGIAGAARRLLKSWREARAKRKAEREAAEAAEREAEEEGRRKARERKRKRTPPSAPAAKSSEGAEKRPAVRTN